MEEQHIYHHYPDGAKVNLKLIKNTKGYNWEITVTNSGDLEEALRITGEVDAKLRKQYGEPTDE